MNSINRIIKESKLVYLILCIVCLASVVTSVTNSAVSNTQPLGTGLFIGFLLTICVSHLTIGINLVNSFRLSVLFNRSRKNSSLDLFKYVGFISITASIFINLIGLVLHYLPENPLVPMIFGMNFNVLSGILLRIPTMAIIFCTIGFIGLWFATIFTVEGVIIGISAIIFSITVALSLAMRLINAILWRESLMMLLLILLVIITVVVKNTYDLLQKFEIR